MAPIGEDAASKFRAAAAAAAIVDCEDNVAVRSKKLALDLERISIEEERVTVLPIWSAMNPEQSWILARRHKVRRFYHHAVNFRAVFALERDVLNGAELNLGEKAVIARSELAQL